jgi:hypothetical protein
MAAQIRTGKRITSSTKPSTGTKSGIRSMGLSAYATTRRASALASHGIAGSRDANHSVTPSRVIFFSHIFSCSAPDIEINLAAEANCDGRRLHCVNALVAGKPAVLREIAAADSELMIAPLHGGTTRHVPEKHSLLQPIMPSPYAWRRREMRHAICASRHKPPDFVLGTPSISWGVLLTVLWTARPQQRRSFRKAAPHRSQK